MASFSRNATTQIIAALSPHRPSHAAHGSGVITVHETIRTFSFLYERIRNVIDYKDEHLIRKAAIRRILKRQLLFESHPEVIANHLVRELIAARYLPNGSLPESLIGDVAERIKKYQAVSRCRVGSDVHEDWLRGILSVELEELLVDASEEKALATFLYERLADRLVLKGALEGKAESDETERRLQVYVACYRSLIKADEEMLSFKLLRAYLPEWMRPQDWIEQPRPLAERLLAIRLRVQAQIQHPLAQRFLRTVKPWSASLSVLRDVLHEHHKEMESLLEKPDVLHKNIVHQTEEQYAKAKTKLRRGTWRATLYLFLTKMLVALLLEVPLEMIWFKEFHTVPLTINLAFPPFLMFMVGLLIKVPNHDNTDRLVKGVEELLSEEPVPMQEIKVPIAKKGLRSFMFTLVYIATFFLTFGIVTSILTSIGFTWISIPIFLFFLCVVSFFAFRLRVNARELVIIEGKPGLISSIADFFSLPILRAGRWLSRNIQRINIFLFIFDFVFEAPFKLCLAVLEDWFAFLKEKKEELQ